MESPGEEVKRPAGGGASSRPVSRRAMNGYLSLLALLRWLRDKLEKLHRSTEDEYVRRNLHALIRACDPDTNPRLGRTLRTWTIEHIPKTANRILRRHWGSRRRDRQIWRRHVHRVCGRPPRKVRGRVRLEIVVHRHTRQDPDNAYASVKNLVDALVAEGWLADDSPDLLELRVSERVERRRRRRRTEITWIPVDPEALEPRDPK